MTETNDQIASLARIEQKLDDVKETLGQQTKIIAEHISDNLLEFKVLHATVNGLLRRESWLMGIGTALMFLFGVVGVKAFVNFLQ
jgi:hypothetical protein